MITDPNNSDVDEDNTLDKITLEFPEYKNTITRLFCKSTFFIEICEDYVLCLESIKKIESINNHKKEKEINDLKKVMEELRAELLSKIC